MTVPSHPSCLGVISFVSLQFVGFDYTVYIQHYRHHDFCFSLWKI